ncbi:MAG TPA: branched-chain amino acid ABC transporter permease [Oligoflexia bacterium]|nr:branched-chain amino acid ABC transporter permease [Oligoflexia bacterium]
MTEFLQHIINGLGLGAIYALIALGYTMVFGILQLINFAHGDVYMLGAFIGYYAGRYLGLANVPGLGSLGAALALAMLGAAVAGYLIERFAYRPLRKSPRINVLITAVGVSLLLEFGGQIIFGADPKFFPTLYVPGEPFMIGTLQMNRLQLLVLAISLVLMTGLRTIIFKTKTGRAMRAVSFNHDNAALMGIPVDRIISVTFMLGSALAGAAGILVGLTYPKIDPLMGVMFGLKAFVAAVVGGIGNVTGAVIGALLMGVAESLVIAYWASTYRDALAFGILILILLFKPAGLLGTHRQEKV